MIATMSLKNVLRLLGFLQRGPVAAEPVEQFGMDGVCRLDPPLVTGIGAVVPRLLLLVRVHLPERPGHLVAVNELGKVDDRPQLTPTDNLKPFGRTMKVGKHIGDCTYRTVVLRSQSRVYRSPWSFSVWSCLPQRVGVSFRTVSSGLVLKRHNPSVDRAATS